MSQVQGPQDGSMLVNLGLAARGEFDAGTQSIELTFDARTGFAHPGGVQGGFITGWIDAAMAHAVMHATDFAQVPMTLEIKTTFLRAVAPGQQVTARGHIVRMGRSIAFLDGELFGGDGTLLASATSSAKLVPSRPAG